MEKDQLDLELLMLAKKITVLSELSYNDSEYDQIEEELHELEDVFLEKYGDFIEEIILEVHNKYCPANDVLVPIAYLGNKYIFDDGSVDVASDQGVLIEMREYPDKSVRLVLVPSPARILLMVGDDFKKEVWKLE